MNLNKKVISKALFGDETKYKLMDIDDFEDTILQKILKANRYDNIPKFTCTYIDNKDKRHNSGFLTIEEFAHWHLMQRDHTIISLVSVINFNDYYEVKNSTISKNGNIIAVKEVDNNYKAWLWLGDAK